MAISPKCARCGEELDEPGGILLGPQTGPMVTKRHLCVRCFEVVSDFVEYGESFEAHAARLKAASKCGFKWGGHHCDRPKGHHNDFHECFDGLRLPFSAWGRYAKPIFGNEPLAASE